MYWCWLQYNYESFSSVLFDLPSTTAVPQEDVLVNQSGAPSDYVFLLGQMQEPSKPWKSECRAITTLQMHRGERGVLQVQGLTLKGC